MPSLLKNYLRFILPVIVIMIFAAGFFIFHGPVADAATLISGDRFKGSGTTVYFYASDGKRYIFSTEAVYFSWYSDYSGIKTINDSEIADVPLGGNIVAEPGTYLVQFVNMEVPFRVIDPKVYAVDANLGLRHVASSSVAQSIYGTDWESDIIPVPEVFFIDYVGGFGSELSSSGDYDLSGTLTSMASPDNAAVH
ncbi:hypothetical protein KJ969_00600 [Patescibacteria group bacterium]|nr:hypothetical protein [Patescibacteria group bacterium]MBU1922406.1 hypothetical protein [Patescibacteria group bacterium]